MLPPVRRPLGKEQPRMRQIVPLLVLSCAVVACSGGGGSGSASAFCDTVKQLRHEGLDLTSLPPTDPKLVTRTIAGLRDLEGSAPSGIKGDVATIRDTVDTIVSVSEGRRVDPKKLARLSDSKRIRTAGVNIDRYVTKHCGIKIG